MSGVSGADELAREEKQQVVILQDDTSYDDEEEAITQVGGHGVCSYCYAQL